MICLVTGGAGFIGSHLVWALADKGHDVRVLDNLSTGSEKNLEGINHWFFRSDIREESACLHASRDCEMVFHLAALPSVARSWANPIETHEVNATGTLRMLQASVHWGVRRFIYASSSSVYGDTDELPKKETTMLNPLSPYAASKLGAEHYCCAFGKSGKTQTIALRLFNVFGPRQNPDSQYAAVIPKFLKAALTGETAMVNGDGEQTRDFTYVDNVVKAFLLAAESPEEYFWSALNIGCGKRTSINQLASLIEQTTGCTMSIDHAEARPGDVRDSQADIGLAAELLGYRHLMPLDAGLRIMAAEWEE